MSTDETALLASKTQFLSAQVRILSQPLKASTRWKDDSVVSGSVLSDVMRRGMLFLLFFGSLLHVFHSTQRSAFKSLDRNDDDGIFDRHESIANCLC